MRETINFQFKMMIGIMFFIAGTILLVVTKLLKRDHHKNWQLFRKLNIFGLVLTICAALLFLWAFFGLFMRGDVIYG